MQQQESKPISEKVAEPHAGPQVLTAEALTKEEYAPAYYEQAWYKKPISQIILVSFVCFMCPGESKMRLQGCRKVRLLNRMAWI